VVGGVTSSVAAPPLRKSLHKQLRASVLALRRRQEDETEGGSTVGEKEGKAMENELNTRPLYTTRLYGGKELLQRGTIKARGGGRARSGCAERAEKG
jgi:hypothetical protein